MGRSPRQLTFDDHRLRSGRGGPRPGVVTQFGLMLGLAGVAFIIAPRSGAPLAPGHLGGIAILLAATLSWAFSSVWSRNADKPSSSFLTVGMQMTAAGLALLLLGLLCGEAGRVSPAALSAKSLLAWFYLFSAGSVIGFTAYIWLLQTTTTARVATHAYVNPVIAVALGIWLGKETLSSHAAVGGAFVLMAVVLILRAPKPAIEESAVEPPALPVSAASAAPVTER